MKLAFIGAGNVATHLAKSFHQTEEHQVVQVISRTLISAKKLAEAVNATYSTDIFNLSDVADIIFICVPDHEIESVANQIKYTHKIVVHTSGATSINILRGKFEDFGVFYPLQTFTKEVPVSMGDVPVCIEANQNNIEDTLRELAAALSYNVTTLTSAQREKLHVAAVFANNFTNYLYKVSEDIMHEHGLNFDLLKPLIQQTAFKLNYLSPGEAQTGPAIRNDQETIDKHLEILKSAPQYGYLYKKISELIRKG